MSRVTSNYRQPTRYRWKDGARDVQPRELDENEYLTTQPGVDEYLLFTLPASPAAASAWTGGAGGSTGRKTKVWRPIDIGSGSGSGSSDRLSTMNGGPSRRDGYTPSKHLQSNGDRRSNGPTTCRVRGKKLTSTGQSPSSPLSPSSPCVQSPASRPSAIPLPNSGAFSRGGVARASMFEQRSRRRQPPVPPHQRMKDRRPHSTSPPPPDIRPREHTATSDKANKSHGDENNNDVMPTPSTVASHVTSQSPAAEPALLHQINNGVNHVTSDASNDVDDDASSRQSDPNIWDFRIPMTDVADIIANLSSSDWSDRRHGLANLQTLLQTDACLTATDLKKVTDIFTRMFHDPQSKVLSVFVEVVVDFVAVHVDDLSHWLPILLPRLFLKLTSDLRGSIHTKVERALEAVRVSFKAKLQIEVLSEFMTEQAQTQCLKLKEATLLYLHKLILDMDAEQLVNSSALQILIRRVVLWSVEPHYNEVRNRGQAVIAAMFNLKASELALAMTTQPKGIQDEVSRILKAHMTAALSYGPASLAPRVTNGIHDPEDTETRPTGQRHHRHRQHVTIGDPATTTSQRPPTTVRRLTNGHGSGIPVPRSALKRPGNVNTVERGRHSNEPSRDGRDASVAGQTELKDDAALTAVMADDRDESPVTPAFNHSPTPVEDVSDALSLVRLSSACIPDELCIEGNATERRRQWLYITSTLSDAAARLDTRKDAMGRLIDALPTDAASISQPAVKSVLHVLLSATHADDDVSVLARECASMLIDHVVAAVPDGLCRLLSQLVAEATFPANLAALQMLHARLDQDFEVSGTRLTILVSSLLKAYEDDDRSVRKAGVDVLVKLYERVGDLLWTYIHDLSDAKASFLKTRFRRAVVKRLSSSAV